MNAHLALLTLSIVVLVGAAVTLIGGWLNASIAAPLIMVGVALLLLGSDDVHDEHSRHARGV